MIYGDWINPGDFCAAGRSDAVAFSIDEKGYIGGGFDGDFRLNDFYEYNSVTDSWKVLDSIPGPKRSAAVAFVIDGKAYVGTGFDGDNYLNDFYVFDPDVIDPEADPDVDHPGEWSAIKPFEGTARFGAVAFAIGGKGYVGTGYDGSYKMDFWEYDPSTDDWTEVSSAKKVRYNASAFVIGSKAYLVGGAGNGLYINDFYSFDPAAATQWTKLRSTYDQDGVSYDNDYENITRADAVSFVMDGKAYLTLGDNGSLRPETWVYTPEDDLWEETTEFEGAARTAAVAFTTYTTAQGYRAFVLTGRSSTNPYMDMWEFLPDQEYDSSTE